MKSSVILTSAAELVDSGHKLFCCGAICWAGIGYNAIAVEDEFAALFKPKRLDADHAWFGDPMFASARDRKKFKAHRVIALLLCAAISESNGD